MSDVKRKGKIEIYLTLSISRKEVKNRNRYFGIFIVEDEEKKKIALKVFFFSLSHKSLNIPSRTLSNISIDRPRTFDY
jgi:hypothetical protein